MHKPLLLLLVLSALPNAAIFAQSDDAGVIRPMPAAGDTFKWQTDQFADVRILRYQIPGWEQLSVKEKTL